MLFLIQIFFFTGGPVIDTESLSCIRRSFSVSGCVEARAFLFVVLFSLLNCVHPTTSNWYRLIAISKSLLIFGGGVDICLKY